MFGQLPGHTPVTGLIAELSVAAYFDDWRPNRRDLLPRPVRLSWAGLDLDLEDAELTRDDGTLVLSVFDDARMATRALAERFGEDCQQAGLCLEDGSTVSAAIACMTRRGSLRRRTGEEYPGVRLELANWEWLPREADNVVLAVTVPRIRETPGHNLVLVNGSRGFSSGHFRGQASYTWHLVKARDGVLALANPDREHPSLSDLGRDLMALEFIAGAMLDVQVAWLVDGSGQVVGGLGFGDSRGPSSHSRTPVHSTYHDRNCWAAPFLRLVSTKLVSEESSLAIAIAGYVDAQRTHIHAGYLLGQVALEAFCNRATPESKSLPLVKSTDDWKAWVTDHENEISAFARNEDDRRILCNKLRDNVFQRPTGGAVTRAFREWGIELPGDVQREIARRNPAAHRFAMFDEASGDFDAAVERLSLVQTLLAAAIAKHVGYTGPIAGWERDSRGHPRVPQFWHSETSAEAEARFVCRRD